MNQAEFAVQLRQEGFGEPVFVERPPNYEVPGEHSHPFEAKALILDGTISILTEGRLSVYSVGQVFHLYANQLHSETYGSAGVKYVVGRK